MRFKISKSFNEAREQRQNKNNVQHLRGFIFLHYSLALVTTAVRCVVDPRRPAPEPRALARGLFSVSTFHVITLRS